jgi:hypothetical protein
MASRFLNLRQADGGAFSGEPINALELDGIEEATQFATAKQERLSAPRYDSAHSAAQRGGVLLLEDGKYTWYKGNNAFTKNNANVGPLACYITKRLFVPNGAYNLSFILLDIELTGDATATVDILNETTVIASTSVAETMTVELHAPPAELPAGTVLNLRVNLSADTGVVSCGNLTAKYAARKPIA